MRRGFTKGLAIGLLLTLFGCFSSTEDPVEVDQEPEVDRLIIALGEGGGANYSTGNAVCVALKKVGSGLPCKLMVSDGSKQNLDALSAKQVDMALVRGDSAYQIWHGLKPYKQRDGKLRVLFSIHHEMVSLFVKQKANILSFKRIAGKAINIGTQNSNDGRLINTLLDRCKISAGKKFTRKQNGTLPKLLSKKSVQGAFDLLAHPDDMIKTLADKTPLQLLPITGDCVEKLVHETAYLDEVIIPGGLYQGLFSDIPTVGIKVWLMAGEDLAEETVYEVVKTVFEGIEQFRLSDPAFYRLSPRKMLNSFDIPYHKGAIKYFQEKGWYKK